MKIMSVCRVLLFLAACLLSATAVADHAWANYHWERSSNPITLPVGDNVDNSWDGYLDIAIGDWNSSSVVQSRKVTGSTSPRRCKADNGTVQVCNRAYGYNGWLGIAGISISGDHIQSGYVKLNDSYFNSSTYNTVAWRQMVMCQEIGHTFGLGHQDENFNNANLNTCMDYTSDPQSNQAPNQHDWDQLEAIYNHSDTADTGGGSTDGGCNPRSPKCNGATVPSGWGRLVSKHGPVEVFELDLGNGNKILTHVTWTIEHAEKHTH